MKPRLIRALGIGAAVLLPVAGVSVVGVGIAGANTKYIATSDAHFVFSTHVATGTVTYAGYTQAGTAFSVTRALGGSTVTMTAVATVTGTTSVHFATLKATFVGGTFGGCTATGFTAYTVAHANHTTKSTAGVTVNGTCAAKTTLQHEFVNGTTHGTLEISANW